MVIVRLELDFLREMTWPGEVRIETEISRIGTKSFTLRQRLLQDEVLVGTAQSVQAVIDAESRRALPLTETWRAALAPYIVAAE